MSHAGHEHNATQDLLHAALLIARRLVSVAGCGPTTRWPYSSLTLRLAPTRTPNPRRSLCIW